MYPDEDTCLNAIFLSRYSDLKECPKCAKQTKFFKVKNRKCYACEHCGYQLHPLSKTIFHKSDTPLTLWFYAIYLYSVSRNGVSAKELERQLGVTYKCAWRIANRIRTLFNQNRDALKGIVEIDEMYVGGRGGNNKRGLSAEKKTPVVGAVERNGNVSAVVMPEVYRKTIYGFIEKNLADNAHIMSDDSPYRNGLAILCLRNRSKYFNFFLTY
jgi:transposase-like protein